MALENLLAAGLAQAYALSPHHFTPVSFGVEKLRDLYFYLTPAGTDAVKNLEELGVDF